jgi:signal transduction histidine kinase
MSTRCATRSPISSYPDGRTKVEADPSELRALTERLEQMREAERTRIARELHDELGQLLSGIKLDFTATVRRFREYNAPPDVVERVQSAMMHIDLAIATVQRIAADLRPAALDHRDLGGAIAYESRIVSTRSGIPVHLFNRINTDISSEIQTAVFRIFQEALLNAIRHARATRIVVRVATRFSQFVLCVRDNGVGLPELAENEECLGITGMRERARSIGGVLSIRGHRGRGTLVALRLPLGPQ